MPTWKHTGRALAAAGLFVTAIGIGAVVGAPGLASSQVDARAIVSAEDTMTSSLVDDVTSTDLVDAPRNDIADIRPDGAEPNFDDDSRSGKGRTSG